ncbi:hypothetical protein AKJ37_03870 [candidate division MSBL1 archaeon SCGC-AAA259I09]|uniref:Biotin transporter n=1 Tax=candidate division MSBL1 archaeon SCGC-AAA259I09 TaxID=1698267 RepID=A0A133USG0_9EURY|nr:hypothetical protein AKJ37_03870 [candidate division MSBL1 archaeon SCGC-AAA259I09]
MSETTATGDLAFAAMFGVLTAAGAFITVPLPFSPVPITGQTFFVLLSGLVLGPTYGAVAMATYLVIGAAGFPVFAGGTGGVGILFGPSGGFLTGFLAAAFTAGYIARHGTALNSWKRLLVLGLAAAVGEGVIYLFGVPWFAIVMGFSIRKAVVVGILPYLPGDGIKAVAAVLVARTLWTTISFGPLHRERK